MEFLPGILKDVIIRIKDQLLLFAIALIALILIFPVHRFIIAGVGVIFAIFYTIIKILTYKSHSENSDYISSEDWPVVKSRILENLTQDSEKLEKLIPLLEDESNSNSIDSENEINSSIVALQDRQIHLHLTPRSKIENEEEINLIQGWLANRYVVNKQLSSRSRHSYIKEKKSAIRESLSTLIEFYEVNTN